MPWFSIPFFSSNKQSRGHTNSKKTKALCASRQYLASCSRDVEDYHRLGHSIPTQPRFVPNRYLDNSTFGVIVTPGHVNHSPEPNRIVPRQTNTPPHPFTLTQKPTVQPRQETRVRPLPRPPIGATAQNQARMDARAFYPPSVVAATRQL